jgi:hypothetical protein
MKDSQRKKLIAELRKEIRKLKKSKQKKYLFQDKDEVREILRKAVAELDWPDLTKVFGFSKRYIKTILRHHKISKPRRVKPHIKYRDTDICLIIDAYIQSQNYNPRLKESRMVLEKIKKELLEKLEKAGHKGINFERVRKLAYGLSQSDLARIGGKYRKIKLPLRWGSIPDREKVKDWLQEQKERLRFKLAALDIELIEEIEKIASKVKIPDWSRENPFILKVKGVPKIACINTPKLGLVAETDPYRSQVKNLLREAEACKCDAVLVTGNLVHIDTKRFSNLSALRSRISGIKTKAELVEDEEAAARLEKSEPVFLSFKEKFDHVMETIREVFTDKKREPIFHGPILICFGVVEENLAIYYANEKMNRAVVEQRYRLNSRIKTLRKLLKEESDIQRKEFLEIQLISALKRLKLIKGTSLNDEFKNKCRDEMTKYIIHRLQEAIPGARVISVGEGALMTEPVSGKQIDRKVVEGIPKPTESIHDTYFGDFIANKRQAIAGGAVPQPDVSIIGGLNLDLKIQLINYSAVFKGADVDTEMETIHVEPSDLFVIQLPTCIDRDFIKQVKRRSVRYSDPLVEFAVSEGFTSGGVILEWVDGVLAVDYLSQGYLSNKELFSRKDGLEKLYSTPHLIYGEQEGDQHIGHPFVARYKISEFPYELYHFQLLHKVLLENDVPICFYINTGDTINAQNYDTWKEVHPDKLHPFKWLNQIRDISEEDISWKRKFEKLATLIVRDSKYSGIISPETQFKEYFRTAIESYKCPEYVVGLKYWAKMLKRAKTIGIKTFGSVGVITLIEGQHSSKTFEGKIHESEHIAAQLKIALRREGFQEEELDRMIKSPLFGSYSLAEGLLGVAPTIDPNNEKKALLCRGSRTPYFYCFIAQHKPAAGRGIYKGKDKGRSIKLHQSRKGTTQVYQQGRFIVRSAGDIHQLVVAFSRNTIDVVSGSQTFYDSWRAYLGLALNNIVTVFMGLPKDGPHTGAVRMIFFTHKDLSRFVRVKEYGLNWKRLFRNALG